MINPSAIGWIDKFFQDNYYHFKTSETDFELYQKIRKTGFIYGHCIAVNENTEIDLSKLKSEEISKIVLLSSLFETFQINNKSNDVNNFLSKTVDFYNNIAPKGFSLLDKIVAPTPKDYLESNLNSRIQTNKDTISKNFSHIVTNSLLFLDVLAFEKYLKNEEISIDYLKKIEETIISVALLSLKIKSNKTENDDLIIKLFESSVKYTKFSKLLKLDSNLHLENLNTSILESKMERLYAIDIASISLWNDLEIGNEESYFLNEFCLKLNLDSNTATSSTLEIKAFIDKYKKEIPFLNFSNPVKHFYDNTTEYIITLINRNKTRLVKEINESKELMHLINQSRKRDLNKEEKKKMKRQLLDVFKTIPSLAIFLLPGATLLFPIFIKFIPQILPSSFNENLEEKG